MLLCSEVHLSLSGQKILENVSLAIPPGQVTFLIGPNGAGKSTLLKTLSGDLKPDRGHVTLDRHCVFSLSPITLALRRSVIPQQTVITFNLSAQEVIEFGNAAVAQARASSQQQQKNYIKMAAQKCRCEHLLHRKYQTLSGGEQARVHLARALTQLSSSASVENQPTRFLLLDEPVASLDPEQQHLTLQLIRNIAESGIGVLATLHDLNLTSQYADQVALMQNGKIKCTGTPAYVLQTEPITNVFNIGLVTQSTKKCHTIATTAALSE